MILGIDYGARRIGLALADEATVIPLPFKELKNQGIDLVILEIEKIIQQEKINLIVVGWPVGLGGQETEKTQETKKFIDILAKKVSIPVAKIDERLTSKLADTLSGKQGSRDVGAAMIILEDFLQRQKE
ncbi:MAG TPA: Holliday junction resolvase RuvX [Candidatus Magasanikbacteria bacterium]|nr:Holliday junction resolvase RuvX [Candidatus Magasanikbacteria bacterium]